MTISIKIQCIEDIYNILLKGLILILKHYENHKFEGLINWQLTFFYLIQIENSVLVSINLKKEVFQVNNLFIINLGSNSCKSNLSNTILGRIVLKLWKFYLDGAILILCFAYQPWMIKDLNCGEPQMWLC